MQIGSAVSNASNGLRAQTQRLEQSAQNVANVNTNGYEARSAEDRAAVQSGGQREAAPAGYNRFAAKVDQSASNAHPSSTDLVSETVTQIGSLQAFRANVAVLRAADATVGDLLNQSA
jgi:flagellar basal body rod protein FlgG